MSYLAEQMDYYRNLASEYSTQISEYATQFQTWASKYIADTIVSIKANEEYIREAASEYAARFSIWFVGYRDYLIAQGYAAYEATVAFFKYIPVWIEAQLVWLKDVFIEGLRRGRELISRLATSIWNFILEIPNYISKIWNGIVNVVSEILSGLKQVLTVCCNVISDVLSETWRLGVKLAATVWKNGLAPLLSAAAERAASRIGIITGMLQSAVNAFFITTLVISNLISGAVGYFVSLPEFLAPMAWYLDVGLGLAVGTALGILAYAGMKKIAQICSKGYDALKQHISTNVDKQENHRLKHDATTVYDFVNRHPRKFLLGAVIGLLTFSPKDLLNKGFFEPLINTHGWFKDWSFQDKIKTIVGAMGYVTVMSGVAWIYVEGYLGRNKNNSNQNSEDKTLTDSKGKKFFELESKSSTYVPSLDNQASEQVEFAQTSSNDVVLEVGSDLSTNKTATKNNNR